MASLAGSFSEYARFPERTLQSCDLGAMVTRIARDEIPPRIRWELRRPQEIPRARVDSDEIERLFRNLVKNAVEAIPQDGEIRLELAENPPGGTIEITVQDSGTGMDAETLRKAFQPGFTTKETGTGLGLALVRSALSHYGGTIRVESERGKGTRCRIPLPAEPAAETRKGNAAR